MLLKITVLLISPAVFAWYNIYSIRGMTGGHEWHGTQYLHLLTWAICGWIAVDYLLELRRLLVLKNYRTFGGMAWRPIIALGVQVAIYVYTLRWLQTII